MARGRARKYANRTGHPASTPGRLLELKNLNLPPEIACERMCELNGLRDCLLGMARSEQVIIPAAVSDNELVNNVFHLRATRTDHSDEGDSVTDELLNQCIESRLVTTRTMQDDFLAMGHLALTLRMSHEGERATGDRIEDQPERAPPHWLNPLVGPMMISILSVPKRNTVPFGRPSTSRVSIASGDSIRVFKL